MLLIPDIHITTKYADRIIKHILSFVGQYPDETDIIFLGDYVYAFTYDRKALLKLFELFITLHHQGKTLYILAGNHDRIGDQFVYEEAKQSRDIINQYSPHKIYFITQPQIHEIQGQTIFFLPFVIDPYKLYIDDCPTHIHIDPSTKATGSTMSMYLNQFVTQILNQIGSCILIHHYYVAQTEFREGSGVFDLQDISLDKSLLQRTNLKMISGHIHHPFIYQNYLCLGSARHTTDRESNQIKILAQYDPAGKDIILHSNRINPIFNLSLGDDQNLNTDIIENHMGQAIIDHHVKSNTIWTVDDTRLQLPILADVKIQYYTDQSFADAKEHIDINIRNICRQIEIKKQSHKVSALINDLHIEHEKLKISLTEWRSICKKYIISRYPEDFEQYMDILGNLKIL